MSQHKRVVRETLNHLFTRIPNPFASDAERKRIALLALDQMEPEGKEFPVADSTIAQVQSAVEGGEISATRAREIEAENDNRKTLLSWLDERIGGEG